MTSAITTYLHRRKSRQAKTRSAASKAGRGLTSNTWDAVAARSERESEDNTNKATQGSRQLDGDEADNLAPARSIAVSVLVGIAMWLVIIAVMLL